MPKPDIKTTAERIRILAEILGPDRKTNILDIGASPIGENITQYSALREAQICKVWSFEPQKDAYEQLLEIQGESDDEFILPYALGDGKEQELKICKSHWFTSLLEPNDKFWKLTGRWRRALRVIDRIPVQTKRLDDIEDRPQFDMIKIDVQGAENEIFQNAEQTLSDTLVVMTEVAALELYQGQGLLDEQMRTLRHLGFSLHKFMSLKQVVMITSRWAARLQRAHRSQIADGDGIFIRSLMDLDSLQSEQLKHLALICDGCLASYDLALSVLEILVRRGDVSADRVTEYVDRIPRILEPEDS